MFETDKLPPVILNVFHDAGIDTDSIRMTLHCDRDDDMRPLDVYIAVTDESIEVFGGLIGLGSKDKDGHSMQIWTGTYRRSFAMADIVAVKVEEMVSSARLTAIKADGYELIASMTDFCIGSAYIFVKYFARLKADGDIGEIDAEDRPESACCPKCGARYPDRRHPVCPYCMEKTKLFQRMLKFFLSYKKYIFITLLSLVFLTAFSLFAPYLSTGFFYDEVLNEGGEFYGQIFVVLGMILGVKLLNVFTSTVNDYITSIVSAKVVFDFKKVIFHSIERLSLSFFTSRQTGGLMTQVNSDANTIYDFFCNDTAALLVNITKCVVIIIIMFAINPLLAACALVTIPLFFVIVKWQFSISGKLQARRYTDSSSMNSLLSDVLTGMRVVKAFSKERVETKRFDDKNKRVGVSTLAYSRFSSFVSPIAGFILHINSIIVWFVGGLLVMKHDGSLTYGDLLTFIAYVNMLMNPMYFFSGMSGRATDCSNAMQRLFEIADAEPDIVEAPDAVHMEFAGKIQFDDVSFSYVKNRRALSNISFTVDAGKTLGVVGHTGAGKSTLANLIMRLYDCESGRILIDDVDVRKIAFEDLYRNIAIVSQETYLFMGTIYDNIAYAAPNATRAEVIHAAKCAGAHDFIMRLPDAYQTQIGFGHKELSGGERQRISIARAILRDPKILILDEATAAMDTQTERQIQQAITELTKNKTTIMIAHRLSTLRDADSLIVIERGQLAESGTHAELLAKENGAYKKLYDLQLEALKNAGIAE